MTPSLAPVVSVVLPVHNGARYLRQAIESIRAQTFANWELIAIDDNSTDVTARILGEFARRDDRIRVLTGSRGLVPALNAGIAASRGELVARMDADDIALPDRLVRQMTEFLHRPPLVALGGQVARVDEQARRLGAGRYPIGVEACRRQLLISSPLCHPAVMLRRTAALYVGGYRAAYRHAEDYDLWLRLAAIGEVDNLADEVLCYRVHGNGVTARHGIEQAASSALAQLAYKARQDGRPEPYLGADDRRDFEQRLSCLAASTEDRLRARLAYWRCLALNGSLQNPARMKAFRRALLGLTGAALRVAETRSFAYMMLRAAQLQVSSGYFWPATQFLLLAFAVAPVASTREILAKYMP